MTYHGDEVELFEKDRFSDDKLLNFLRTGSDAVIPKSIERASADPFGFTEHRDIHGATAENIYGQVSYIGNILVTQDPKARKQLATTGRVELPEVRIGQYIAYRLSVSNDEDTGNNRYHLLRTDRGNPGAGFHLIPLPLGKVIIKSDLELGDDESELLIAAQKAVSVYAFKSEIDPKKLSPNQFKDHLSPKRIEELNKRYKQESSLKHRSASKIAELSKSLVRNAYKLVSVPDEKFPTKRDLSIRRLALLAMVLPIPGYSEGFFESPVLRPATVELSADIIDVITEEDPVLPSKLEVYNSKNIDLPDTTRVSVGISADVEVIDELPDQVKDSPTEEFGITSVMEEGRLGGSSPMHVLIKKSVLPGETIKLPIDSKYRGKDYFFGSTDPDASDLVTIQVGLDSIILKNTSSRVLTSIDLSNFWFDTRK